MAMLIDRRYNPFRDFEDIDRSFFGDNSLAEFKTDIRDIGDAYVMECDLPGFRKEDIALNLHDKVLTIKAERHSDFENAEKKGSYLRCERSFGSYTRSFDVTGVDTTKVRAAYNNGVLAITLPKYVKPQPTAQTIPLTDKSSHPFRKIAFFFLSCIYFVSFPSSYPRHLPAGCGIRPPE